MKIFTTLLLSFVSITCCFAQPEMPAILSLKQQGELHDTWLSERAKTILPMLMAREGVDMWIIISREYNEGRGGRRFGNPCLRPL